MFKGVERFCQKNQILLAPIDSMQKVLKSEIKSAPEGL
jgi:hypothetical protein